MKKVLIVLSFILISQTAFGGRMEEFTLKNNIKVIFNRTDGIEVVSMKVFTPASVLGETNSNAGISLMTANLMAKSTKNRSSEVLAKDVDNIGADLSANVDHDMSFINMSFLSEFFDKASEILSDVIKNPAFNQNEIDMEKKNTIAGLNARKDRIFNTAMDNFIKKFYEGTPYALTVLGSEESINSITAQQLAEWHKNSFNASNILISISGNVDIKTVKNSLDKYFADIEAGKKFEKPEFNFEMKESYTLDIKSKFNQAYIMKGFPAPELKSEDFVTLKVISAILGGRMTSRLFTELREKLGLAYEVNAMYPSRVRGSYFLVYIGLDKKNIDLTLNRIREILKDMCENEVGQQELSDTKTFMRGIYILDRQTVWKRSYYYGWREVVGQGYKYDDEFLEDMAKVTSKDIIEVANRIFNRNSLSVIVRPEEVSNK